MMTVAELRSQLANFPDDIMVVLSKDGEGNIFSPLADVEKLFYEPENTWSGVVWSDEDIEEFMDEDHEWELPTNAVRALILWPTN